MRWEFILSCFTNKAPFSYFKLLWRKTCTALEKGCCVTRLKSGLNETHIGKIEINKEDYKERSNKDRTLDIDPLITVWFKIFVLKFFSLCVFFSKGWVGIS